MAHDLIQCQLEKACQGYDCTVWHRRGAKYSDGAIWHRARPDPDDKELHPILVDKERIARCRAYRRLKHKTQVFWAPRNDHLRTRSSHTDEVIQTSRRLGFLLGLNLDLIEAIARGHDIGHPPFGHAGERALQEWIRKYAASKPGLKDPERSRWPKGFQFDHHALARRLLEEHNLTLTVLDGVANPSLDNSTSLEAQVVGIADDLTWIDHDVDDFREAGLPFLPTLDKILRSYDGTPRQRMERAIREIVVHSADQDSIRLGNDLQGFLQSMKSHEETAYTQNEIWHYREQGAAHVIDSLMQWYMNSTPDQIGNTLRALTRRRPEDAISVVTDLHKGERTRIEVVVDHVAKMTDTFANDLYEYVFAPKMVNYHF